MNIEFRQESFRDDFTFRNSPAAIRRFPFPFHEDSYMYSVNMEPHVKGAPGSAFESLIDVDEHYISEMKDRAAVLKKSKKTIEVHSHQSILEAVEAAGVDAPFLCRGGACGQCETNVISCDGTLEHNDHYLEPEDKASGRKIMICVSRLKGHEIVLDL